MSKMKTVTFVARPAGEARADNFRLTESDMPKPAPGQVLVKTRYLSLDPYFIRVMTNVGTYTRPLNPGDAMFGRGIGEIVESNDPAFAKGEFVLGTHDWQEYCALGTAGLTKVEDRGFPLSAYVGAVGQSGFTAWIGLNLIANMKRGETVCVSAATGAVGGVVGQLAKLNGCKVVGIAGGPEKCALAVSKLGFDHCVDHRGKDLAGALRAAAPQGIDIYFENVGAEVLDAVLANMNDNGRIPICGLIAHYENSAPLVIRNFNALMDHSLRLQAFGVHRHEADRARAIGELRDLAASGKLLCSETVTRGIENAPEALIAMLRGKNIGKSVVQVA